MKLLLKSLLTTLLVGTFNIYALQADSQNTRNNEGLIKETIKEIKKFEKAVEKDEIKFKQSPVAYVILGDLKEAKQDLEQLRETSEIDSSQNRLTTEYTTKILETLRSLNLEHIVSIEKTHEIKIALSLPCSQRTDEVEIRFLTYIKGTRKEVKGNYRVFSQTFGDPIRMLANGNPAPSKHFLTKDKTYHFWVQHIDDATEKPIDLRKVHIDCANTEVGFLVPEIL